MAHSTPHITFTFSKGALIAKAAEHIDGVINTFNQFDRAGYPRPYTVDTEFNGKKVRFLFHKKTWKAFKEMTVSIE